MKKLFDRSTRYYTYDGVQLIWQRSEHLLLIEQQTLRQVSKTALKPFNGYVTHVVAVHLELATLVNFDVLQNITQLILDNNWLTVDSFRDLETPMPSVTTLSINNNDIEDVKGLGQQLCDKFPNLIHLSCLCNRFEDMEFLVKALPGLRTLNGKKSEIIIIREVTEEEILNNQKQQQKLISLQLKRSSGSIRREKLAQNNAKQIENIMASLQKRDDILMESFLEKRIDKNLWRKRYCCLYADGILREFEGDTVVEKIIFGEKQVSKSVKPRAFKIEYIGEKHLYRALTDETFNAWLIKIEKWF